MAWPEELTNELPSPRDDEPASLRQDIADELADHLHCALNRELHRNGNETVAKQSVLARFGNPARIAYRLWFDAMKEKIMSQRITLTAVVVLVVVCLFMGAMSWQVAQQNSETSAALLEQSRELNAALLDKLAVIATSREPAPSMDWNQATLKLVFGDAEKGLPAKGFKVSLSHSVAQGPDRMPQVDRESDENGVVDFGMVRFGEYYVNIISPWGEALSMPLTVLPGKEFSKTIVCPSAPKDGNVSLQVNWPDDLKTAGLGVILALAEQPFDLDGHSWRRSDAKQVIVPANQAAVAILDEAFRWGSNAPAQRMVSARFEQPIPFHAGNWKLVYLRIVPKTLTIDEAPKPVPDLDPPIAAFQYSVEPKQNSGGYGGGSGGFFGSSPLGLILTNAAPNEVSPEASTPVPAPSFELKEGESSAWKIELPPELIDFLRKKLKAGEL